MRTFELEASGVFPEMTDGAPARATHKVKNAPPSALIPNVGVVPILLTSELQVVFESSIEDGDEIFREALLNVVTYVWCRFLASGVQTMSHSTYYEFLDAIRCTLQDLAERGALRRRFLGGWVVSP